MRHLESRKDARRLEVLASGHQRHGWYCSDLADRVNEFAAHLVYVCIFATISAVAFSASSPNRLAQLFAPSALSRASGMQPAGLAHVADDGIDPAPFYKPMSTHMKMPPNLLYLATRRPTVDRSGKPISIFPHPQNDKRA